MGSGADHCLCQPRYSTGRPVLIACSTISAIRPSPPIAGGAQPSHLGAFSLHHRHSATPSCSDGHAGLVVGDWDRLHRHHEAQRLQRYVQTRIGDAEGGELQQLQLWSRPPPLETPDRAAVLSFESNAQDQWRAGDLVDTDWDRLPPTGS
jgi:hypothetical protein